MRHLSSGVRAALIAAACLGWLVFYAAWLVLQPGGDEVLRVFADTAYLVPLAAAAGMMLLAWRRVPPEVKPFWRLMFGGSFAWLLADTAWCTRDLIIGSVPYPWWSDAGYMVSYAFFSCAIYTAFRPRFRTVGAARLLEGAVVVTCLGAAWWWFLMLPLGFDPSFATLTNLAYGASGLLLIGLLVTVRLLPARQGTLGMRLVALGIGCGIVANALYMYASQMEGYLTGALTELGWEAQGALFTLAAYIGACGLGRAPDWMTFKDWPRLTTPILASVVLTTSVLLIAIDDMDGSFSAGLFAALAVPVLLVAIRATLDRRSTSDSSIDPATGTFNEGSFGEQIRHLVARGTHFAEPFVLAIAVPDGPLDGESLARLHPQRDVDTLSQLDDGRLALLFARADEETAGALADQLREDAASLDATFSIGIAPWIPGDELEPAELVAVATVAAGRARALGGNQVSLTVSPPDVDDLLALAELVEEREGVRAGHSRAIADLAAALARALALDEESVQRVYLAGYLHDLGKVSVPTEFLRKQDPLETRDRQRVLLQHPRDGVAIIERVESARSVAPFVLAHHEAVDGTGYPNGLRRDAIPLEGRILAVADSLVSMIEDRPYRPALSETHALTAVWQQAGRRYDREVVTAALRLSSERELRLSSAAV